MFAIQGYFEGDRFFPEQQVNIPQRKRAIVTILDDVATDYSAREKQAWFKFMQSVRFCDEALDGAPERTRFTREIE